jgi:hypothetical protein
MIPDTITLKVRTPDLIGTAQPGDFVVMLCTFKPGQPAGHHDHVIIIPDGGTINMQDAVAISANDARYGQLQTIHTDHSGLTTLTYSLLWA